MNDKKLIFVNLEELERKVILSKLNDAISKSNEAYYRAMQIIQDADNRGHYDKIKLLNQNINDL